MEGKISVIEFERGSELVLYCIVCFTLVLIVYLANLSKVTFERGEDKKA